MISICVFSKNRACQLDAMLNSLYKNASYFSDIKVLYTHERADFAHGYDILIKEHPDVQFIKEESIPNQVIPLVESFHPYFCWATDDSLFYMPHVVDEDKLSWVFDKQQALSLNLRVGLNIVWQNHWHSERTPSIPVSATYKDLIAWDSSNISVQNDVGRLWQNDASIMPRDKYLERLKSERHWQKSRGCRGLDNVAQSGNMFARRIGAAFANSVYVNVPVNLVHLLDDGRLYADNWGKYIRQDIGVLNQVYLKGARIDWEKCDFNNLDCGRKEVEYSFK